MNRIILMVALVLSLTACDNTKVQLRAPEPQSNNVDANSLTAKSDSTAIKTGKKDSVISH